MQPSSNIDGRTDAFREPSFVVAVGASAGGLEALEKFFGSVPEDSGMAYIVAQHLSPNFKTMMDELLARHTKLPIRLAENEMRLEANQVYLLPPKKDMIVAGGRLLLTDKDSREDFFLPIDHLFRSLGQDYRERSIGVILSGTGGDGSRGLVEIHESGGLVLAQSEETAAFDGMTRSAQNTGLVDLVLAPQDMPSLLMRYSDNPSNWRTDHPSGAVEASTEGSMNAILKLLRKEYGIDFSSYKPDMIARRIERRLLINESASLESYVDELAENPDELAEMYRDLLIGVTGFFRDPEAYQRLEKKLLPDLISRLEPGEDFRVWVAATATGEEAYSIAILIDEYFFERNLPTRCRVFATDVHLESLEIAAKGIYSEDRISDLSPERLSRYFRKELDGYHVSPELRRLVVFAPHNVISDAPFTKLDLVTCRNLFIYFKPDIQRRVLTLFHFGLKVRGGLWLGSSEVPTELVDEFEALDAQWKMYSKRRDVRLTSRIKMPIAAPLSLSNKTSRSSTQSDANVPMLATYDQLLGIYMPPSMLISEHNRLLHSFGGASKFIQVSDGRMSNEVTDQIHPDIRVPLATALRRAKRDREIVKFGGIRFNGANGAEDLTLHVRPLVNSVTSEMTLLVEFDIREETRRAESVVEVNAKIESAEHVTALEDELRYARESLNASIEELQSANEEMQSTNEELVASNEELQSTNEELHSVNEELYTVNAEYHRKITELTELTDDMDNLLNSTHVDTIFLDRQLKVRKFTPDIAQIFNLIRQDIGRGIESFTYNLDDGDLVKEVKQVLASEQPFDREVRDRKGHDYLMRILPYVSRGSVDGVVLTLVDITNLRRAETQLAELSDIVRQSDDAIFRLDSNGLIRTWNDGAEQLYGHSADIIGEHFTSLVHSDHRFGVTKVLQSLTSQQTVQRLQTTHRRMGGEPIEVAISLSPIRNKSGEMVAASVIARDISDQVRAENEIREAVRRRDQFLAMLSHELRNPLGAIVNAARLMASDKVDQNNQRRAANVVIRQSNQMSHLLDDLLDVSRITLGKIELKRSVFDFAKAVYQTVQATEPSFRQHDLKLTLEGCDDEVCVDGDPTRLQQVVDNLIRNAIKYTPSGGHVFVSLIRRENEVELRVKDDGVGIADDMMNSIFEMFVQTTNTLERSQGGIGVGLTLVKALVMMHDGSVDVFSEGIGRGSEFRVRLPLANGNAPKSLPRRYSETPTQLSGSELSGSERSGNQASTRKIRRIVVIEDIADAREMLVGLLELNDFEVTSAKDGVSGLELIEREKPDLALVDIGIPKMDGYEVARKVRSGKAAPNTYLVALTGYGQSTDQDAALKAGFNNHLVKPLSIGDLERVLADRTEYEPASSIQNGRPS